MCIHIQCKFIPRMCSMMYMHVCTYDHYVQTNDSKQEAISLWKALFIPVSEKPDVYVHMKF